MIDIHSHLLPGIDDGADSLDEALAMCRIAAQEGCRAMIATPHLRHQYWWNDDRQAIESLHRTLRQAAKDILDVHLGGEIAIHSESCGELEALPHGQLLTLAGSRYVLLEFDRHGLGPDPVDLVHELRVNGFFPIIAHPERVAWLASQDVLLRELVRSGAHLQLTGMSLTGHLGRRLQDLCLEWIEQDLVDFVASDAHQPTIRPPGLALARDMLTRIGGSEMADRILVQNPQAVLDDRPIER